MKEDATVETQIEETGPLLFAIQKDWAEKFMIKI